MMEQLRAAFFSSRYRKYISLPWVTDGAILPSGVELKQLHGALTEEKKHSSIRYFAKKSSSASSFVPIGFPVILSNEIKYRKYSPSRKLLAVVRKPVGSENADSVQDLIEIWNQDQLVKAIHMKNCGPQDSPEAICTDDYFGGMQWSSNEDYICFTTLRDRKKQTAPFYDTGRANSKKLGEQFAYEESWGNSMDNIYYTSLWVAKISSDDDIIQARKVPGVPEDLNVAQPIWSPGSSAIIFIGKKRYERRFGQIYCINRAAGLYRISVQLQNLFSGEDYEPKELSLLTENCEEDFAPRYPSFSPNGESLVYFTAGSALGHSSCSRLRKIQWNIERDCSVSSPKTVIDMVRVPEKEGFPGIYNSSSPQSDNFLNDTEIIFQSNFRSRRVLLVVDIIKNSVREFSLGEGYEIGSYSFYDFFSGEILLSYCTPTTLPQYFVVPVESTQNKKTFPALYGTEMDDILRGHSWQLLTTKSSLDNESEFESILISPEEAEGAGKFPLIAYPHGGPHGWTGAMFVKLYSYFVSIGYHVLLTNYRGSTGYGEDVLESLYGNCGRIDTQDVMDAINHVCSMENVDETKVVMAGGSHGGFIAGNLLGMFPDRFKAGILRNPVLNLVYNVSASDIPTSTELNSCGSNGCNGFPGDDGIWQGIGRKEVGVHLCEEKLQKMYRASPISKVEKVKAPTIIILGLKDSRVTNHQGQEFYYNLVSRNVPSKVFAYNDPHAITQVHFDYDAWMNISLWLENFV